MNINVLSPQEQQALCRGYTEEKKTLCTLANEFSVITKIVKAVLEAHDISIRSRKTLKDPQENKIVLDFKNRSLEINDLADKYNVSPTTIRRYLRNAGIKFS